MTALLYLTIFGHALRDHVQVYPGVSYTSFLVPGLVMMSVLQNSFANSSSSLIQSKITGNIVFVLLPPLSHCEMFARLRARAMVRGLAVGFGVFVVTVWFVPLPLRRPALDRRVRDARRGDSRHARHDRRRLGREVRPARRVPELPGLPLTFLVGRVLLDAHAAAVLAGSVAAEPVLLHDRRLSLRLLRGVGCQSAGDLAIVVGFFVVLAAVAMRLLATGYKLRH